jgi:hypothetical protein
MPTKNYVGRLSNFDPALSNSLAFLINLILISNCRCISILLISSSMVETLDDSR